MACSGLGTESPQSRRSRGGGHDRYGQDDKGLGVFPVPHRLHAHEDAQQIGEHRAQDRQGLRLPQPAVQVEIKPTAVNNAINSSRML